MYPDLHRARIAKTQNDPASSAGGAGSTSRGSGWFGRQLRTIIVLVAVGAAVGANYHWHQQEMRQHNGATDYTVELVAIQQSINNLASDMSDIAASNDTIDSDVSSVADDVSSVSDDVSS